MSKKTPERIVRGDIEAMLCEHQQTDLRGVFLWATPRGLARYDDRFYKYGGLPGMPDYAGYGNFLITPEMVGLEIARYIELEAKKPGEKPKPVQARHIAKVNKDGGHAGWADSATMAHEFLIGFRDLRRIIN